MQKIVTGARDGQIILWKNITEQVGTFIYALAAVFGFWVPMMWQNNININVQAHFTLSPYSLPLINILTDEDRAV